MTKDNNLVEIENCVNSVELETPEIKQELLFAINDFKHGGWNHIVQGVIQLLLVGLQIPQAISGCKNMEDEIKEIVAYVKQFEDIKMMSFKLTQQYLYHRKQVDADIAAIKEDYSEKKWFATGEEAATVLTLLLPIEEPEITS